jgi:hypothetical protein
MQIVLRLLCLASLTAGGIKTKNLESIKREILQVCRLFSYELPKLIELLYFRLTATIIYRCYFL